MLSLAVLRSGRAEYYLEVASGREDYYLAGSEAPGYWLGANAAALGLNGVVNGDDLRRLLDGIDPNAGEQLVAARTNRTPGFDLTFSAPKSVSILHALASPEVRTAARAAHAEAVARTLEWLEAHACDVRRGAGGARTEPGDGFIAAAFEHRTSRAGDPQLHTHVLVANLTRGPDGRWPAPDGRRLFALSKTAGYLYESELRHQLTESLGVEFGTVHNGIADLRGVPRAAIDTFSQRCAQIIERLDELGLDSARAAQLATLTTRDAKVAFDVDELRVAWNEIAAEFEVTEQTLDDLTRQTQPRPLVRAQVDAAVAVMAGESGLTAQRSTFDRRHVIQEWCERRRQGAPIDTIERLADHTLANDEIIELDTPATATIRRNDGRTTAATFASRYSTKSLVALERQLLDLAHWGASDRRGIVAPDHVNAATVSRSLDPEQVTMVEALTGAGRGIEGVIAPAGAGKTYALGAANEAWTKAGYTVIGGALAARAARQLENDAHIPSTTIARLTHDLRQGHLRFDPKTVLVIDEAAMAGTRTLAPLMQAATSGGAKVVLVGDTKQLAEIDAGGLVRALDHLTQEAGYTALSRGRAENRIYTIAPDNEHDHDHTRTKTWREELERALNTSTADQLAASYLPQQPDVGVDDDYGMEL